MTDALPPDIQATLRAQAELIAKLQAELERLARINTENAKRVLDKADELQRLQADWEAERARQPNEGLALERLSSALTNGNASTWDELFHAAEQVAAERARQQGLIRTFESWQGELIPVYNDEFFRASDVRKYIREFVCADELESSAERPGE